MEGPPVAVAVRHLPTAAAVVDAFGLVIEASSAFDALMGRRSLGERLTDLVEPAARARVRDLLAHPAPALPITVRFVAVEAMSPLTEVSMAPSIDGLSTVVFATPTAVAGVDDTLALRAPDLLGHGVVIGDGTRVLHVSDAAADIFGRPVEELLERGTLFRFFEPSEQGRLSTLIADRLESGGPVPEHFETVVARPDGTLLPVELWVKAVVAAAHVRTYTLISDASEQRKRQRQLAYMATHDHLTGLPNRYLLLDRLETIVRRLDRLPAVATLSFIDLDHFKAINDTHGHSVGDAVLRATADRLVRGARACDTVARLGGDEFVVLCSDAAEHSVASAQRARLQGLLDEPIRGDGWTVSVAASIGTLSVEDGSVDPEALLARADLAMYEAKRRGS